LVASLASRWPDGSVEGSQGSVKNSVDLPSWPENEIRLEIVSMYISLVLHDFVVGSGEIKAFFLWLLSSQF